MSDIENLEAVGVGDERVTELYGDAGRLAQRGFAELGDYLGRDGVLQAHHHQPSICEHVSVDPCDGDAMRPCQRAFRIESQRTPQEVVPWLAIQQGRNSRSIAAGSRIADND